MSHELYNNPLIARYSSPEMGRLWGDQRKFETWRQLWIWLAEAEQELGLPISDEQLAELKAHTTDIDFDVAAKHELALRHDVMAHVHTYGDVCPTARPIIHLGATSCFITDNTDLILLREGLTLVRDRLVAVIDRLAKFAAEHRDLPCLAYTHLQPAQPTTVGKRATLWAYDLVLDLEEIERRIETLRARSTKGTTGTQASFLSLFDGDEQKVAQLEQVVAKKIGFDQTYAVTGQTYSRKVDSQIVDALSGIAQSAHKAASDMRILQSRKELSEPFGKKQIGSSAMAYKRNPMRSERICSLARFVMSLQTSTSATLSTQWMERTLDDSANRRLVLPQAFLAIDAVLSIYQNVADGLVVFPKVVEKNLGEELPMMATENLLMAAVRAGGDRQELHEVIRTHSVATAKAINEEGADNDLIERLSAEPAFKDVDFSEALDATQFVGRAPQQVDQFVSEVVEPIRQRYPEALATEAKLRV